MPIVTAVAVALGSITVAALALPAVVPLSTALRTVWRLELRAGSCVATWGLSRAGPALRVAWTGREGVAKLLPEAFWGLSSAAMWLSGRLSTGL